MVKPSRTEILVWPKTLKKPRHRSAKAPLSAELADSTTWRRYIEIRQAVVVGLLRKSDTGRKDALLAESQRRSNEPPHHPDRTWSVRDNPEYRAPKAQVRLRTLARGRV